MALALPNVLGKNFQLVTRTLPASVIKRERQILEREREGEKERATA